MTSPDRPETPTSTADMLRRTRRRAAQLRRRRRGALTALGVAVVAAAVAIPLALTGGSRPSHQVEVVSPPTTAAVPSTTAATGVPRGTVPPTGGTATTATSASTSASAPTTSPIPSATTVPAVPACAAGQLRASLTHLGAAAGSSYYDLVLTNAGTVTCTTGGYPGVSYVTGSTGTMVGAAARRNPSGPVVTVTLAPGQAARATLSETDAYNYPPATCRLTTVTGLRVYPPNQTAALFVPQSTQACANAADPDLLIGPLASATPAG